MKYLILFLISFSASANFVKVSELESGAITKVFSKMKKCGNDCIRIPTGFNKSFHKKEEIQVPDYDSPIVSKSESESCSAVADDPETTEIDESKSIEDDCQAKLAAKVCSDSDERAIKVLDEGSEEVYCTKTTYPIVGSGKFHVVEDADLKAAYEIAKAADKAAKKTKKDGLIALKEKLEEGKTLNPPQLSQVLKYLLEHLK